MAKEKNQVRKRVRTGCLTCRRKHKKCDENRNPRCDFCTLKGLTCIWPETVKKMVHVRHASKPDLSSFALPELQLDPFAFDPAAAFNGMEPVDSRVGSLDSLDPLDPLDHLPGIGRELQVEPELDYGSFLSMPEHRYPLPSLRSLLHEPVAEPLVDKTTELLLLGNFVDSVAAWLDMFGGDTFASQVPVLARENIVLYNAMLALSARHLERKRPSVYNDPASTVELYRFAVQSLANSDNTTSVKKEFGNHLSELANSLSGAHNGESSENLGLDGLATGFAEYSCSSYSDSTRSETFAYADHAQDDASLCACLLLVCFEMISVEPARWRHHLSALAPIFRTQNAVATPLRRAIFWCFARLDAASVEVGEQATLVAPEDYPTPESSVDEMQHLSAVVFCLLGNECSPFEFDERWAAAWTQLQKWFTARPASMREIVSHRSDDNPFPRTLFSTPAAVTANQMWHMCHILMVQNKPRRFRLEPKERTNTRQREPDSVSKPSSVCSDSLASPSSVFSLFQESPPSPPSDADPDADSNTPGSFEKPTSHSPIWHAKQICGISLTNVLARHPDPHRNVAQLTALQPLCIAARLVSSRHEHNVLLRLFRDMEACPGFGGLFWRGRELCEYWQNEC
ncbi:unnamed protein product [Kuraishia capsulata CBS 1993]|uniref:Zn(2)-C6 fungal-type domain-containing protein n=1 Tax=Kuraishia capsulata CBS 1993 TaxID=1382522 RepID=W6MPZ2_9ASCO|nr:uncharacterized protein KUCA_T00003265001 [Kuraishia capsulata CBS 1993]CDK27287.1 unnamed protein product [Kuraishia capsulata CBS 1993]